MPRVKVWNNNDHPHIERFKGKELTIGPHESIDMEYEEAKEFAAQFTMPVKLGNGTFDPRSYKMIVVEEPDEPIFKDEGNVCHANGQKAATPQELAAIIAQFSHMQAKDPEAERAVAAAQNDRVANLEAQVAELKAMLERKSKVGRPAREAV